MEVSSEDIILKIEKILSDILSDKYDAKVTIKFIKKDETNGDHNTSRDIKRQ